MSSSMLRRWFVLVLLAFSAVGMQVGLEGRLAKPTVSASVPWVRSPAVMRRLTLGFNALWADVYWIRAVQYFGGTRLSKDTTTNYDQLYPLLNITTTLDPRFNIAYRLGAILLAEGYRDGTGDPELALALLEKGMREMPERWQYPHDAGFVNYWWKGDATAAAEWFLKAAAIPDSPDWLRTVAASMYTRGGARESARDLWRDLAENENEWIRGLGRRGLMQLEAETQIELLTPAIERFHGRFGRFPTDWKEVVAAGVLRERPVDPSGHVYALDPATGVIDVERGSPLYPLRDTRLAR
jgi:hypothetical protein